MKWGFRFDIISDYMIENNMFKEDFCKLCGITITDFDKMRFGDVSFEFGSLCKIADKLDIDLVNFFLPHSIPLKYNND